MDSFFNQIRFLKSFTAQHSFITVQERGCLEATGPRREGDVLLAKLLCQLLSGYSNCVPVLTNASSSRAPIDLSSSSEQHLQNNSILVEAESQNNCKTKNATLIQIPTQRNKLHMGGWAESYEHLKFLLILSVLQPVWQARSKDTNFPQAHPFPS